MGDLKLKLAQLSAALEASPADLGTWLDLALELASAGRRDAAAEAFAGLGAAASEHGQVALGVACARWLSQAKHTDAAAALVGRIATTHGSESERIDRSSRPRPPAPPGKDEPAGDVQTPASIATAVELAMHAVGVASEAADARTGETLPPTALLGVLAPDEIRQLVEVTRLARRNAGHVVVDVGQPAEVLFWLARGSVAVSRDGDELGELRSGAVFGEIALLAGTTRTATVSCREPCWLLEIPAKAVERLAAQAPNLAAVLAEYAKARLLSNLMRTSELFKRIDEAERKMLLRRFESDVVRAGEQIMTAGEDNDRLHVIVSGQCEVVENGSIVATLGVGDGFGESSLLRRAPAVADVVAAVNTVTLTLSRAKFDDIAVKHPELLAEVYKLLVEREQANQRLHHDAADLII